MKGLSGSVGDGRCLIAATARKMSLALISYEGDVFFPMAGSESAHSCVSWFWLHVPSVPYCMVRPLRCVMVDFN